jgi:site-specific DNA recombinase
MTARAAIYARVSTNEQALHGWSVQEQERLGLDRVESQGWTCEAQRDVYLDAGWSGGRDDRPDLQRLIASLGEYDFVIVWKLDRLTRSTAMLTRLLTEFERHGVGLVSLTEPIDGSTPMGRAMVEMMGVFAQLERSHTGERTRMGKQASVRSGRRNGGPRPYGYAQAKGTLTLIPAESAVLKRMRDGVLAGKSLSEIARGLNRDGIKTVRGVAWTQTRISQVLANPLYIGKVTYKGEQFEGQHEPVFMLDEWRELQAVLSSRRRNKSGRGQRSPRLHLFSRHMLRCGCCGGSMVPRSTWNSQGRHYATYRCLGQLQGSSPDCTQPTVRREQIDGAVLAYFERVGLDVDATRRQFAERIGRVLGETNAMLVAAEREAGLASDRLARVKRDYLDGSLSAAEWRELRSELEAEAAAASSSVERLRARADEVEAEGAEIDAAEELLGHLAELRAAVAGRVREGGSVEGVRAALLRLFDGFSVHALTAVPGELPALPSGWIRSRLHFHPDLTVPGRGGLVIEPHPRAAAILDDDQEAAFPQLRRVPLDLSVSPNASGR